MAPEEFEADEKLAGMRLDKALTRLMPGLGLRAARRMLEDGSVFCNDRPGRSSDRVRIKDRIIVSLGPTNDAVNAKLIAETSDFYFFYKPVGMHTVKLAGRNNITLEGYAQSLGQAPIFLQRLDRGTAGIICAAKSEEAAVFYRQQEKIGHTRKYYYAVLQNGLEKSIFARSHLLTPKNSKVRFCPTPGPEQTWTYFEPLWIGLDRENGEKISLARCVLSSGVRHQVRVHALSIGHPLLGDPVYGNASQEAFILEHYRLRFGDYDVCWLNPEGNVARLFGNVIEQDRLKGIQDF